LVKRSWQIDFWELNERAKGRTAKYAKESARRNFISMKCPSRIWRISRFRNCALSFPIARRRRSLGTQILPSRFVKENS
jgi:hypothetical protein